MEITFFHFGAVFFGLIAIFNYRSARKYEGSYLTAILGTMMFIASSLFLVSKDAGSIVFFLTMIFTLANYKKIRSVNENRMKHYIRDSNDTDSLKFIDYFTGWKLIHCLSRKYGAGKASLIYSIFFWLFGVLIMIMFTYLWPDVFSNMGYLVFVMTVMMLAFYWQNKKLLDNLERGNLDPEEEM